MPEGAKGALLAARIDPAGSLLERRTGPPEQAVGPCTTVAHRERGGSEETLKEFEDVET